DHVVDQLVGHHQLDLPLRYLLDPSGLTEEGFAALQGAELAFAQYLPAAAVVLADATGPGGEDRGLHLFQVAFRHVETEFVHPAPPSIDEYGAPSGAALPQR